MKYAYLVWAALRRKPARAIFTLLALVMAFLLYGLLDAVNDAFALAVERQRVDRLIVDPRFGNSPLPVSYASQIESVPGVTRVAWTAFLPAYFQREQNNVIVVASEADRFFAVRDEFKTRPEYIRALRETRNGIIVLESLATREGWKLGDNVVLNSRMHKRDGSHDWTFQIVGFLNDPDNPAQLAFAVMNFDYFEELREGARGTVGRYVLRIRDARRSAETGAAVDKLFANSSAPTRTQSENEIAQSQLARLGDVGSLTRGIIAAVFLSILLLTGNNLLQSVRERTRELAVLRTLGYTTARICLLLFAEMFLLCVAAALLGLAAASWVFPTIGTHMPELSYLLAKTSFTATVVGSGLLLALILALASSVVPVWRITRSRIVDGLATR